MKTAQLAALCFTCLLGIMPVAASAKPYVISADGSEVTDQKTGLIWRRCAEGMVFSGRTCKGAASTFTHEDAFKHAAAKTSSTRVAWRLPNAKELSSIVDKSLSNESQPKPTIDSTAFPATPANWFWSSAPGVGNGNTDNAYYVSFGAGKVDSDGRGDWGYVRLVRTVRVVGQRSGFMH